MNPWQLTEERSCCEGPDVNRPGGPSWSGFSGSEARWLEHSMVWREKKGKRQVGEGAQIAGVCPGLETNLSGSIV